MTLKKLFFFIFFLAETAVNSSEGIFVGAEYPSKKSIPSVIILPGTVLANESVEITTVVSEKIKTIHFEEGSFVKKNQLLVELIDKEEKAILNQSIVELEEAKLNYERALKLSEKGNISQAVLDNRLMIKNRLESKVEEARAKIDDLKIRAPFDGYTSVRNFSKGALLKPGDVITNLYDIDSLKIQGFVSESYASKINNNLKIFVDVNQGLKTSLEGTLIVVDPLINKSTRTFEVIGKIENNKKILKPGMMVNFKIPLGSRIAKLVKEGAVFNEDDISFVYVIENNIVKKKQIKIGSRQDGMVEIIQGVNLKDLVIYEGINKIKENSKVRIK